MPAFLRLLQLIPLVLPCLIPGLAWAQQDDAILVPVPTEENDQPNERNQSDPVMRLIALQNGLYDVVLTYDAAAAQVEKAQPKFEESWLQLQQSHALHPSGIPLSQQVYDLPFAALLLKEPTLCARIDQDLKAFIRAHTAETEQLIKRISTDTANFSDEEKASLAKSIRTARAASHTDQRRAQEILYLCLHRYKNEIGVTKPYSIEKTLREWFNIQAPLVDLWLGPVD